MLLLALVAHVLIDDAFTASVHRFNNRPGEEGENSFFKRLSAPARRDDKGLADKAPDIIIESGTTSMDE